MQKLFNLYLILFLVSLALDVQCQDVKDEQVKFLKTNAHSIQITGDSDYSDLKVLDKQLKGKRIVLLGEFTHGAKEVNLIKNRVIAYLHDKLGFNVLLLESGIGEVYSTHFLRDSLSDRQMIYAGLTGPWYTQEYLELMNYLKARKRLTAGGFDVQRTGSSFAKVLERIVGVKEMNLDVEKRFTDVTTILQNRNIQIQAATLQEKEKLVSDYRSLSKFLEDNRKKLEIEGWDSPKLRIIRRTLGNRIEYLNYFQQFRTDNDFRKRFAARDLVMAENFLLFTRQIYPNEKIIVSAHNYHIAKSNEKETVMGESIRVIYKKDSYSIGVFGGKGEYADNSRKTVRMAQPAEENDIQNVISRLPGEATFLHIPEKRKKGAGWLFEDIFVNNSFVNLDSGNKLVLTQQFDGLILINNISPPKFIN